MGRKKNVLFRIAGKLRPLYSLGLAKNRLEKDE